MGFRADIIVEGLVIIEIKSVDQLARVHKKQVMTYLKLSGLKVGMLINFGGELLKGNIERIALGWRTTAPTHTIVAPPLQSSAALCAKPAFIGLQLPFQRPPSRSA